MTRLPNDCFALPPGVHWTPVEEALQHLRARLSPVAAVERLAPEAALGRALAADALAVRAHPATDNAAVDGYAFRHPGAAGEVTLTLRQGRSAAGAPWAGELHSGEALRILTGAAMPAGADTVVLQEDVALKGGQITFPAPRRPGANRRKAGENLAPGDLALAKGSRITPQAIAHLAAAGLTEALVHRPLKVAVLSTGDELVAPGAAAAPDQVIDSNRPMLMTLLSAQGIEGIDGGVIPDDRAAVTAALDQAVSSADAVIASGGASGGEEDHMAQILSTAAERGEDAFHLWRIAVKPGRPLAMGMRRGAPVFGLPGNPVAAFVCFLIFLRPALGLMGGYGWRAPTPELREIGFDYPKKPGRREYLRVRIGPEGRLEKYRSEGSGLIEGLVWADGLADLDHEAGPLSAGERVRYLPFSGFGL